MGNPRQRLRTPVALLVWRRAADSSERLRVASASDCERSCREMLRLPSQVTISSGCDGLRATSLISPGDTLGTLFCPRGPVAGRTRRIFVCVASSGTGIRDSSRADLRIFVCVASSGTGMRDSSRNGPWLRMPARHRRGCRITPSRSTLECLPSVSSEPPVRRSTSARMAVRSAAASSVASSVRVARG